jgi:hypothetical protein
MTHLRKTLALVTLAASASMGAAQTTAASAPSDHRAHHRPSAASGPPVEEQINQLRQQMQSQIDALRQQLSNRDAQLQQATVQAQEAAHAAQQAANEEQQTITSSNQAFTSLQNSVADLKASTSSTVSTVAVVRQQQTQLQQQVENPDAIRYKGVSISPHGSFLELATVNRNRATGSDITTPFSSIPLEASDAGQMSEFYMTGRQSRVALLASGKLANHTTLRGYYEMDWLGAGLTSNNNQSNSYVLRDRQLWAQVQSKSGWLITGGQQWSLPTAYTQGLMNRFEAIPTAVDANYHVGFIYTRQPSFRVAKNFRDKFWIAASVEQAQTLNPSCSGENFAGTATIDCPLNYVIGAPGNGTGTYNGGGSPGTGAPLTGYTYNLAPDLVSKIVAEPGYGHYELFGIARFFRDRVYPTAGSSAGAWNDTNVGGGVGGSARFPVLSKKFTLGFEGLYGDGAGRYGASQLPDVTLRPDGQLSLIHNASGLLFLEGHATHRLDIYAYYGEDYAGRDITTTATGETGYGLYTSNDSGCNTQASPGTTDGDGYSPGSTGTCQSSTKDDQEGTAGYWFNVYSGSHGTLRQGVQYSYLQRYLWSGLGGVSINTNDGMVETSFRYYLP